MHPILDDARATTTDKLATLVAEAGLSDEQARSLGVQQMSRDEMAAAFAFLRAAEQRAQERERALGFNPPDVNWQKWREQAGLGKYARFVSPPADDGLCDSTRVLRWRMAAEARTWTIAENQKKCCRVRHVQGGPTIRRKVDRITGEEGHTYWHGLVHCGSWHSCPLCAPAVSARKAEELKIAIDSWRSDGMDVYMATFTVAHSAGDDLDTMSEGMSKAFSSMLMGAPWLRIKARYGLKYQIKATEATHGKNGWHLHFHVLFFSRPISKQDLIDLEVWLHERWVSRVRKYLGDSYIPLPGIGVKIQHAQNAASYVAKMGLAREVSSLMSKLGARGNRTPWQILRDWTLRRKPRDRELMEEWNRSMFGRHQLHWSKGAREGLLPPQLQLELSDEELATLDAPEDEVVYGDLADMPQLWDRIASEQKMHAVIAGSALEYAERGDLSSVRRIIGWALDHVPALPADRFRTWAGQGEMLAHKIQMNLEAKVHEIKMIVAGEPTYRELKRGRDVILTRTGLAASRVSRIEQAQERRRASQRAAWERRKWVQEELSFSHGNAERAG